MITLSVHQKGGATYPTAISMRFSPQYMSKMVETIFGGDSRCTQFVYEGTTYVVSQSVAETCDLITTANTIRVGGIAQSNITQLVVGFNLANVAMVENVEGKAGIYYTQYNFTSLIYALSTANTDYASISTVLEAYGFVRCQRELGDGTTRPCLINTNAVESTIEAIGIPTTYTFPSGMRVVGNSLYTYTSQDFTGILSGDTLDTITTGYGTITLNLPCVTAPNRTAIAAAITAWLNTNGAQHGTVAVTAPASGQLRIVIPSTNVAFIDAVATISATPTTKTFTAS